MTDEIKKIILERNYEPLNVTDKTIEMTQKHPNLFRGHVRTAIGKLYTTEEFKEKSDRVLKEWLP